RITDRSDHEIGLAVDLDTPGNSAGGEQLGAGRSRHTPDVARGITVMRRHLPSVALPVALREIIESQLGRSYSAAKDKSAVSIIAANVIARLRCDGNGSERFVPHSGDVKMAFALTVKTLFPQIAVPAFKENREKAKFVFFAQSHRSENEESRIETTRPEQIRVALSTSNGFGVNPQRFRGEWQNSSPIKPVPSESAGNLLVAPTRHAEPRL